MREQYGSLDAVVNAVSAYRAPRGGAFGGGELAAADLDAFRGWTVAVAEQAFVFLSAGAAALQASGGGALVQITGGSSRRAYAGRGLWAAGAFATRALVQAAAQELRGQGIHVALLAVDATIDSPKTEAYTSDQPKEALADMGTWRARSRTWSSRGLEGSPTSCRSRPSAIAGCRSARRGAVYAGWRAGTREPKASNAASVVAAHEITNGALDRPGRSRRRRSPSQLPGRRSRPQRPR